MSTTATTGSCEPKPAADGRNILRFPRIDKLLSYVILFCGIWTAAIGARQIVTAYSLVPYWDEWQEIDAIVSAPHHQPPLSWLWTQHSEHRIVFQRFLLLADIHMFHGKHWIGFGCILAVQILFLACFGWMLHFCGVTGTLWRAIVGLGAFALFCPSQWENFSWAFQVAFVLPGLLLLLALASIFKYQRSVQQVQPQWVYLGLSILAAAAATYANANGVIVWPLLVLVSIALVPRREVIASYIAFGVITIGSYLYHYAGPSGHASPLNSLRHPLQVSKYIAAYLGVILPYWVRIRTSFAVYSGIFGLLLALAIVVIMLWRRKREPLQIAVLGFMLFAVATAFLTALGRLNFGLEQAFSSRYQTFNLMFWFSTGSLLLLIADRTNTFLRTLVLAGMSAAILFAIVLFPLGLHDSRARTQQAEAAATALLSDVPDKRAIGVLFPEPLTVLRDADYFRQQHLFMFSDVKNNEMGQSLSANYRTSSQQQCQGQVTKLERVPPEDLIQDRDKVAFRVSGSALDRSGIPVHRLVFVSGDKIVGYGASIVGPLSGRYRDMVRKKDPGEWRGFVLPLRDAKFIDVYAIDGGADTACHLATAELPQ